MPPDRKDFKLHLKLYYITQGVNKIINQKDDKVTGITNTMIPTHITKIMLQSDGISSTHFRDEN